MGSDLGKKLRLRSSSSIEGNSRLAVVGVIALFFVSLILVLILTLSAIGTSLSLRDPDAQFLGDSGSLHVSANLSKRQLLKLGDEGGARYRRSWLVDKPWGKLYYLFGTSREIGVAFSKLTQSDSSISKKFENYGLRMGRSLSHLTWLSSMKLKFRFRNISEVLPAELLSEAMSAAFYELPRPNRLSSGVDRYVWRNSLYELDNFRSPQVLPRPDVSIDRSVVSDFVQSNLFLSSRCVREDRAFIGFSLSANRIHHLQTSVIIRRPRNRIVTVSVALSGQSEPLFGVSREGLVLMASPTHAIAGRSNDGVPVSFLIRHVLESAKSYDDAIGMLKSASVLTPVTLMLYDRKSNRGSRIEKDHAHFDVTSLKKNAYLVATNHFRSAAFHDDAENDIFARQTTSARRASRLEELMSPRKVCTKLDAVDILRDRQHQDASHYPLGDSRAIESFSNDIGIVLDIETMTLWLSHGPSTMGEFSGLSLHSLMDAGIATSAEDNVPADTLVGSSFYKKYSRARLMLAEAKRIAATDRINSLRLAADALPYVSHNAEDVFDVSYLYEQLNVQQTAVKLYEAYLGMGGAYAGRVQHAKNVLGR